MKGSMEEFERKRRQILTAGEWSNPCSQQHVRSCVKRIECGLATRDLTIVAEFCCHYCGFSLELDCRDYTGGWRSPTSWTRCHRGKLLVASYDMQGNGRISLLIVQLVLCSCFYDELYLYEFVRFDFLLWFIYAKYLLHILYGNSIL